MNKMTNSDFSGENLDNLRMPENFIVDDEEFIIEKLLMQSIKLTDEPDSKSKRDVELMSRAVIEIVTRYDGDEEVAQFLEEKNSTLVYHRNPKRWTKREIACAYMDTICVWCNILRNDSGTYDDGKIYRVSELYAGLQDYTKNALHRSMRKVMSFKEFKSFLKAHANVKEYNHMYNSIRLSATSVCGLRQRKNYNN